MTGPRYSQAGLQALKYGDRIVPARQQLNLLAAVESLPRKWRIKHTAPTAELVLTAKVAMPARPAGWHVTAPTCRGELSGHIFDCACHWFSTYSEAREYVIDATAQARAAQLAAITSSEGAGQ